MRAAPSLLPHTLCFRSAVSTYGCEHAGAGRRAPPAPPPRPPPAPSPQGGTRPGNHELSPSIAALIRLSTRYQRRARWHRRRMCEPLPATRLPSHPLLRIHRPPCTVPGRPATALGDPVPYARPVPMHTDNAARTAPMSLRASAPFHQCVWGCWLLRALTLPINCAISRQHGPAKAQIADPPLRLPLPLAMARV